MPSYQNKAIVYGILFEASVETLKTIASDPKHLGAEIGLTAVFHTWARRSRTIPTGTVSCRNAFSPAFSEACS
jgi:hypothetical protein